MDATALHFPDASFDNVSPGEYASLSEPCGVPLGAITRAATQWGVWSNAVQPGFGLFLIRYHEGFLHGESRFLDPLGLASRYTDGDKEIGNLHTWPVTKGEMKALLGPHSSRMNIYALGPSNTRFHKRLPHFFLNDLFKPGYDDWAGVYI
jgi:hypothetical protein